MFKYNDGGREFAGYSKNAGDCVTRAVSIASGIDYQIIYDALSEGCRKERTRKNLIRRKSARDGVNTMRKWFKDYMVSIGFEWVPTMWVGVGCQVHLRAEELPQGRLVVMISKHATAMIDGVIHDTYDPSREGKRCVYGYWMKVK